LYQNKTKSLDKPELSAPESRDFVTQSLLSF